MAKVDEIQYRVLLPVARRCCRPSSPRVLVVHSPFPLYIYMPHGQDRHTNALASAAAASRTGSWEWESFTAFARALRLDRVFDHTQLGEPDQSRFPDSADPFAGLWHRRLAGRKRTLS